MICHHNQVFSALLIYDCNCRRIKKNFTYFRMAAAGKKVPKAKGQGEHVGRTTGVDFMSYADMLCCCLSLKLSLLLIVIVELVSEGRLSSLAHATLPCKPAQQRSDTFTLRFGRLCVLGYRSNLA